jgi:hypothetical protein
MTDQEWADLMSSARKRAHFYGCRVRVRGYRLTPRSARFLGKTWIYTWSR